MRKPPYLGPQKRRTDGRRKARAAPQAVFVVTGFIIFGFLSVSATRGDPWGVVVSALLATGLAVAVIGSRTVRSVATAPPAPPSHASAPIAPQPVRAPDEPSPFAVQDPGELPTFADVGGMLALKTELEDTFGLLLSPAGEAPRRKNGLLLHGPPGVGKAFIAKAVAGELGLNLIRVNAREADRTLGRAFDFAAARTPCVVFFDEFDSIAQRDDARNPDARRTVDELLREVEQCRRVPGLIVIAATDELDALDPAVTLPGRFDRHLRVDPPDAPARAAILGAVLKGRPLAPDVDLRSLAVSAEGLTPAAIARAVEAASLAASKESTGSEQAVPLTSAHLRTALEQREGTDRPTVADWSWDRLILPARTKAALQQVVTMVKNPEQLGVEPPAGLLLTGPPGTGKSTIAKVLAAQAGCSFHTITGADLTSPWLGESERSIARLFDRARDNQPSIIFLDEVDAIAGTWGELLAQIGGGSGQRGVCVVGATNRPHQVDPALLCGGRLSRSIEVPLPDFKGRIALLQLFTVGTPLDRVDVDELARRTAGLSGADLKALCQQAAVEALTRSAAVVTADDMDAALAKRSGAPSRSRA